MEASTAFLTRDGWDTSVIYRGYAQDASWSLDMLFPGPPDPDAILDAVPAMTSRLVTIHV